METKYEFQLSSKEFEYLKQFTLQNEVLIDMLKTSEKAHSDQVIIQLSRSESEYLRDYLTTQLAKFGFDENYEPNEQGEMLETLIDRLFIP